MRLDFLGCIKETRYDWPKSTNEPMQVVSEAILKENEVSHMTGWFKELFTKKEQLKIVRKVLW